MERNEKFRRMRIAFWAQNAREVEKLLWGAFHWSETKEGHKYWNEVAEKLKRIGRAKSRRVL